MIRAMHRAVVYESSARAASEIVAYANLLPALAVAGVAWSAWSSPAAAVTVGLLLYVLLRAALAHRVTIWIAAALGTLAVAAVGGGLGWLFAHVIEHPAAPPTAAVLGALAAGAAPAWAYLELARRRMNDVPDSLLERAPSMPPSG